MRRKVWMIAPVLTLVAALVWAGPVRAMVLSDTPLGAWVIRSYKMSGPSAWGDQYAKVFINQRVVVTENTITFGASICPVHMESQEHDTATYFHAHYKTDPVALGLTASSFTLVKSNCSTTGFDRLLFFNHDTLVMNVDTVFFFMERE